MSAATIRQDQIFILEQGAFRQLLNARHPDPEVDLRTRTILILQRTTGMRISEALALNVAQVWNGQDVLSAVVLRADQTKGQRMGRALSLIDRARLCQTTLRQWLRHREKLYGALDPSAPLFVSTTGHRLDRVTAHRALERWARAACLPVGKRGGITTHTARHTKLSELMNAGKFNIAQAVAGHVDQKMLNRYLHVPLAELHDHNATISL